MRANINFYNMDCLAGIKTLGDNQFDLAIVDPPTESKDAKTTREGGVPSTDLLGNVKKGDYVLATKYCDGDPHDHWVVGFFDGSTSPHYITPRYNVVDSRGKQFRHNGFRRVKKISAKRGEFILKQAEWMVLSGYSVWHFARMKMGDYEKCII